MRFSNLLICFIAIVALQNAAFSFSFPSWGNSGEGVLTKLERKTDKTFNTNRTLPEYKWNNLRTTYVPGIYCQQVADDGTYRNQKHYFFNTKTQNMVEIKNLYYVSNVNQLGEYKNEFLKYGAKSDTFTYKGKKYTIPNVMGHRYK